MRKHRCLLCIRRFNWKQCACCVMRTLAGWPGNGTGPVDRERCHARSVLVGPLVTPRNAKCNYRSIALEGSISNWTPIQSDLDIRPRWNVVMFLRAHSLRQTKFGQVWLSNTAVSTIARKNIPIKKWLNLRAKLLEFGNVL